MGVFQNNLLAGAGGQAAGAAGFYSYQVEQSVRFENASTSRLSRTAGTPTNVDKYTFSTWFKFVDVTSTTSQLFLYHGESSSSSYDSVYHRMSDNGQLRFQAQDGGTSYEVWSNKLYRDTTGFSHIMVVYDSAQSTASDRVKIFHNGVQVTLDQSRYSGFPAQNRNALMNTSGATQNIGNGQTYGGSIDGYFAETLFFDGQAYSPSDVTETKNGVLIPKDPSSLTFGNNGFHLKYENASDLGNDSSGNNNDFTASGLGTDHQVLDSPTFGS
jgi:hypothetical protein